jgi:hypothetical protein
MIANRYITYHIKHKNDDCRVIIVSYSLPYYHIFKNTKKLNNFSLICNSNLLHRSSPKITYIFEEQVFFCNVTFAQACARVRVIPMNLPFSSSCRSHVLHTSYKMLQFSVAIFFFSRDHWFQYFTLIRFITALAGARVRGKCFSLRFYLSLTDSNKPSQSFSFSVLSKNIPFFRYFYYRRTPSDTLGWLTCNDKC